MKTLSRIVSLLIPIICSVGCDTGYTKSDGKWTYVVVNGAVGREVLEIDADVETFEVLSDPEYAKDKDRVFRCGRVLEGADGATYRRLGEHGFAIDAKHAYYRDSIIAGADVDSFRLLTFPYARDDTHVYCGSLRMVVESVENFKVLSQGDTYRTSYFHSTEDLTRHFGEEYAQHEVKWDPQERDYRYVITSSFSGTATDGVWRYEGPKRTQPEK